MEPADEAKVTLLLAQDDDDVLVLTAAAPGPLGLDFVDAANVDFVDADDDEDVGQGPNDGGHEGQGPILVSGVVPDSAAALAGFTWMGAELLSVQGESVAGLTFSEAIGCIVAADRPVQLCFARPTPEDIAALIAARQAAEEAEEAEDAEQAQAAEIIEIQLKQAALLEALEAEPDNTELLGELQGLHTKLVAKSPTTSPTKAARMPEPEPEHEPSPEIIASGGIYEGSESESPPRGGNASKPALVVRRYRQQTDAASVRRVWPAGLLANTLDPALGYPATLIAEEEAFVRETMATGDMCDLAAAYQSDPDGATDFWVATEEEGDVVVGMIGLRRGNGEGVADIGRFGVDEGHRGRGAARLLLRALELHAWHVGCFVKITATTCGLNLPALAAFESCGFRVVFNGRKDGKPLPEWAPFARLEKCAAAMSPRLEAPGDDEQGMGGIQEVVQDMVETNLLARIDERTAEPDEHEAAAIASTVERTSSHERQTRTEVLLRKECDGLRKEKAMLAAEVTRLQKGQEALVKAATQAAIAAVSDRMEATVRDVRRLSDENDTLKTQLMRWQEDADGTLDMSLGLGASAAMISPVANQQTMLNSSGAADQREAIVIIAEQEDTINDLQRQLHGPRQTPPRPQPNGNDRLDILDHTGSLSPQELIVARLLATGADRDISSSSTSSQSPSRRQSSSRTMAMPSPERTNQQSSAWLAEERLAWQKSAPAVSSEGGGAVTSRRGTGLVNGSAAWLPRGTPGRKHKGSPEKPSTDDANKSRSSRGGAALGGPSRGKAKGSVEAWVDDVEEEPSMALQSANWASGLRGNSGGSGGSGRGEKRFESAAAQRRRRRLLEASSSHPRTPQRS